MERLLWTLSLSVILGFSLGKYHNNGLPGGPCKVDHWFPNQSYVMTVNDVVWLRSAPIRFRLNGKEYNSADGGMEKISDKGMSGNDVLGDYMIYTWTYKVAGQYITINFKPYLNKNYLILQQHYINKTTGTTTGNTNDVISHFPSFNIDDTRGGEMGYLSIAGWFSGDQGKTMGRWSPGDVQISTGLTSGPVAFFDKNDTVIISPFSEFTAASTYLDLQNGRLSWGLKGGIEEVPEGYLQQFIVFYSPDGINAAFRDWGEVMRKYYDRPSSYRESDFTNNYLGYWTDHGAYYFYHPEQGKQYEQTVYDVLDYANKMSIPYRYFQYDEWFYNVNQNIGTITWDALSSVFPNGMRYVYNKTELPVHAHNKWWSNMTTYAKRNGGQYNFAFDDNTGLAIPLEESFWTALFLNAKTWGMVVYEQDFLGSSTTKMKVLNSDVYMTKNWLNQMGNAARKIGVYLQYCMSFPQHILAALEIPVVTQARVSGDNVPGTKDNWKIGIPSLFTQAIGIAPYKDNFWTTGEQTGNPYNSSEPTPFLQLVISVLSTGPVGPGDGIGYTNVSMLMSCCNADGLILKPDLPALPIDNQIRQAAFRDGSGPSGEVYVTKTVISGLEFGVLLAADIQDTYNLTPEETGLDASSGMLMPSVFLAYEKPLVPFNDMQALSLSNRCAVTTFCLYYLSPVITAGNDKVMIYGEVNKITPMSRNRVTGIKATSDGDIRLMLTGVGNEKVTFRFFVNQQQIDISCVIGQTQTATLSLLRKDCGLY